MSESASAAEVPLTAINRRSMCLFKATHVRRAKTAILATWAAAVNSQLCRCSPTRPARDRRCLGLGLHTTYLETIFEDEDVS